MSKSEKGYMKPFNDINFPMGDSGGIRMIFDMKGSRSLYFKVTGHQAYDLFCKYAAQTLDDASTRDFAVNMLFSGVRWFSMSKSHREERSGGISFRELPVAGACKRGIQFSFSTGGDALICVRFAYANVTMRAVRRR